MPWQEAVRLLVPMAHALAYAHEESVIHRDIKPANILMTRQGIPMLSDFGVAKILDVDSGATLTGTNVGIGTPEYMAPEQWVNKVVPQTDIYALGIVFFELLTGKKPYSADTPAAVLLKQASDPLPRPKGFVKDIPDEVERVIFKALAKKPEERFVSMVDFAVALEKLVAGSQAEPKNSALFPKKEKIIPDEDLTYDSVSGQEQKARRIPAWGWGLGGLVGLGMIIAVVWLFKGGSATNLPIKQAATLTSTTGITLVSKLLDTIEPSPIPADTSTPEPTAVFELQIGSTVVSEKDGMTLVIVPQGEFEMGSDNASDSGKPAHTVWLDAFWIDRIEVTNAMFTRFVQEMNYETDAEKAVWGYDAFNETTKQWEKTKGANWRQPHGVGSSADEQHPVVQVSWNDAKAYCEWAGRRLPTEAEWEKAARGSDGRIYPWGNEYPAGNLLNFADRNFPLVDWAYIPVDDGYRYTAPVGSYPDGASPYGALDMAGNVMEWVADLHSDTYYSSSPVENPQGPRGGNQHIQRGGDWGHSEGIARTYYRDGVVLVNRADDSVGFRCALSAAP